MSGGGRRGRRGGRRQRRREEQARQQAAQHATGPSGPGQPVVASSETVLSEAVRSETVLSETVLSEIALSETARIEPALTEAVATPGAHVATHASAEHGEHPRPMSARELVARLEAARAHEAATALEDAPPDSPAQEEMPTGPRTPEPPAALEPRRFVARGGEWFARVAGHGSGGTGRIAPARIEAIRFSPVAEPDRVAAEVLLPHARLDDLYDEELAELLERGLGSRKEND